MIAYYNERDPFAAQWLRNLITEGLIAPGRVDDRSIEEVRPDDLAGFTQCHFFAGIGGWSYALRLVGVPDDRPVWTGSCPCQPFSAAGKGAAADDERHLWPVWFSLIRQCRPAIVFGEQVEAAVGWGWLDLVFSDLETEGYACGAAVLPACSVGAPHIRNRLWFVADASSSRCHDARQHGGGSPFERPRSQQRGEAGELGNATGKRCGEARHSERRAEPSDVPPCAGPSGELGNAPGDAERRPRLPETRDGRTGEAGGSSTWGNGAMGDAGHSLSPRGELCIVNAAARKREATLLDASSAIHPWSDLEWLPCTDGKARSTKPGIFPLAHGVSARVGKLRGAGNAIVPQIAAEFIRASMPSETVEAAAPRPTGRAKADEAESASPGRTGTQTVAGDG